MVPWWNDHTAGWIGAVAGTANGLLGALAGTLAGILVPRGKAKQLIYALMTFGPVCGIAALVVGFAALGLHQPYAVWYPLILVGGMDTLLFGILMPVITGGYRKADARRMEAEELRRS
jgi:hypothetical protein